MAIIIYSIGLLFHTLAIICVKDTQFFLFFEATTLVAFATSVIICKLDEILKKLNQP